MSPDLRHRDSREELALGLARGRTAWRGAKLGNVVA